MVLVLGGCWFFVKIYFMCLEYFAFHVCVLHVRLGSMGGQKVSDSLELELRMVMSHMWVTGTAHGPFAKATDALSC